MARFPSIQSGTSVCREGGAQAFFFDGNQVSTQTNNRPTDQGRMPPSRRKHALRETDRLSVCVASEKECVCACVCMNVCMGHEAEQHWGPKAASETLCRAVLRACWCI